MSFEQEVQITPINKLICTTHFEQKFALAYVTAKVRAGSDHVPLILNFGIQEARKPSLFRFEKWWLEQPDFKQLVTDVWNTSCAFESAIDVWQFKNQVTQKESEGWAININAHFKNRK
jgi:hypothetical protein